MNFVPYDIVVRLKYKGFGDGYFINRFEVLYTEVINWFRCKHDISIDIFDNDNVLFIDINYKENEVNKNIMLKCSYKPTDFHYILLNEAIDKAIKLITNN